MSRNFEARLSVIKLWHNAEIKSWYLILMILNLSISLRIKISNIPKQFEAKILYYNRRYPPDLILIERIYRH